MSRLQDIWTQIDLGVANDDESKLQAAIELISAGKQPLNEDGAEECYAAGYAAYMIRGSACKSQSEDWMLKALIRSPGHPLALLYLAYLALGNGDTTRAVSLALSLEVDRLDLELADRVVEMRVLCLSKLGLWNEALYHLGWFEKRLQDDPDCGLFLINFIKMRGDPSASAEAQPVLDRIRDLTSLRRHAVQE